MSKQKDQTFEGVKVSKISAKFWPQKPLLRNETYADCLPDIHRYTSAIDGHIFFIEFLGMTLGISD